MEILFPLANAYYLSGDIDKAIECYKKIIQVAIGGWYFGDLYARSHYQLGRMYEEQGSFNEAKSYYKKFLFIWEEADEGLAEKIDAQKRLAILEGKV